MSKAVKPYTRVALAADRYNIFGYWQSRTSIDPQISLQSGRELEERSDIFHFEGQTNWNFLADRGRTVVGASYRNTRVNTSGTLMDPVNDDLLQPVVTQRGLGGEPQRAPLVPLLGQPGLPDAQLL